MLCSPVRSLHLSERMKLIRIEVLGQGGAQGFEDAVTLGILFPLGTPSDSETISSRLRLFESLRKPRASDIQTMSNRIGRGLPVLRIGELVTFRVGE